MVCDPVILFSSAPEEVKPCQRQGCEQEVVGDIILRGSG